jgi:hypothetical protein
MACGEARGNSVSARANRRDICSGQGRSADNEASNEASGEVTFTVDLSMLRNVLTQLLMAQVQPVAANGWWAGGRSGRIASVTAQAEALLHRLRALDEVAAQQWRRRKHLELEYTELQQRRRRQQHHHEAERSRKQFSVVLEQKQQLMQRLSAEVKVKADLQSKEAALQRQLQHAMQELDSKACVICQDEQKNVLFLPCRHMCACGDCSRRLVGDLAHCPICRSAIRQRVEVYQ